MKTTTKLSEVSFIDRDLDAWSYAIIEKWWNVHISSGKLHRLSTLDELEKLQKETKEKIIFITPFCLATVEKWYSTIWNEPILAMEVNAELEISRTCLLRIIGDKQISFWNISSSISDEEYKEQVEKILWEIKWWNINQMIFSREFFTELDINQELIFWLYKKLLLMRWQYMTFLFHTPEKVFLWATPERHLYIRDDKVIMNPIAWTMWKWDRSDFFDRFLKFLNDNKEIWELWMVIDEELKMMMKITDNWFIDFPLLRETWAVIHTEADLIWNKTWGLSNIQALRETLYAPTLVWWPIKSAFNQIAKYENNTRWYYWWVFWTLWNDFLDTAIVIRTAFIDKIKRILSVRAWAWIVMDSIPENESKETIVKSKWFFWAFENNWEVNNSNYLAQLTKEEQHLVYQSLLERSKNISDFYFKSNIEKNMEVPEIKWKKFVFLNSWDDFVYMSAFMIQKMWWVVEVVDNLDFDIKKVWDYDVIVIWPWYWDINDEWDERMVNLLGICKKLIEKNVKILWICLGHQAICKTLWYEIKRQEEITQWVQKEVEIDWKKHKLAFYNSFSPVLRWEQDWIETFFSDRILTFNKTNISSIQAHPESIMSIWWFDVLKGMVLKIIS